MIVPNLLYEDVAAALAFLHRAYGFEETLRYADPAGAVTHAEMRHGDGQIMLGHPGPGFRSPRRLGQETVHVHVYVEDVDAHFAQARAAGAEILSEPADHSYGERGYATADPEGHRWHFTRVLREVKPDEWGATQAPGGP